MIRCGVVLQKKEEERPIGPGEYKDESSLEYVRNVHSYNITRTALFQEMSRRKSPPNRCVLLDPERMLKPYTDLVDDPNETRKPFILSRVRTSATKSVTEKKAVGGRTPSTASRKKDHGGKIFLDKNLMIVRCSVDVDAPPQTGI